MSISSANVLDPFIGPKLKVERANEHIITLKRAAEAYAEETTVSFGPLTPASTRQVIFSQKPPPLLPCLIGDAVHNLRAALDILVCDIARMRAKSTKNVRFPFATDAAHLEKRISDMKLDAIDPQMAQLIRALEPFHSGNKALRDLHDLDIQDKHELLIPVFSKSFAITHPGAYIASGMASMFNKLGGKEAGFGKNVGKMEASSTHGMHFTQVEENGTVRIIGILGPQPHEMTIRDGDMELMATDGDPTAFLKPISKKIQFYFPGTDYPFSGQPVVQTLEYLSDAVTEIVELFRTNFSRN